MPAPKRSPWDVELSAEKREAFAQWLCREIENAKAARSVPLPEVEYWWTLYEQGRTRAGQSMPWQDAADLTSPLGTEKVDALRARIMKTVFVDPVWTVEGWGDSAKKAPFVEDFHQWQVEAEGLQPFLSRTFQASLIETRGVLEVYEDTTYRTVRKTIRAQVQLTPDGQPVLDAQFQPVLMKDESDNFIEVTDPNVASAEVVVDIPERVRKGPGYRVLPYKNFLVLPSHAKEKADIWGYAKYFTKRWDLLQADARRGIFDAEAVQRIHDNPDVSAERTLSGNPEPVAAQEGATAEKELWEIQLLHDLDGKGLRWYVATVHLPTQTLLRLVHEDHATHRFIVFVPFPRSDKSHEGYSFIGNKLITIIEEHTAWRNMLADRASLEIAAPIKRQQGALWDPDIQPFGPKAVIDVRDMKEIEAMQLPAQMQGAITREQEIVSAGERVAGINDVALGQSPQGQQTLGEVNIVTEQSFVRMDEVIKNLQEPLEDLWQVRQAIWINCLKEKDAGGDGMYAPASLIAGLEDRGGDVSGMVTADMLEGKFRGKPRGSTENADITRQRTDYVQFMQSLGLMFKTWPALQQVIGMNPEAAKSAVEQALRLFRIPDKQAWLGQPQQPQAPGMPPVDRWSVIAQPPAPPGLPPGMMPPGAAPQGMPPQAPQGT